MNENRFLPDQPDELSESSAPWRDVYREDFHVAVYKDRYPVTPGHLLFVPKYNTLGVVMDAVKDAIEHGLEKVQDHSWDGFNVGINYGAAAGQTVPWPHVHLIPRRVGDMEDPRGGVRYVIPEKGNYKLSDNS